MDAVGQAPEILFNELDARWCGKEINRAVLLKTDRRALEPVLGFFLRTENVRCLGQDLGELPSSPALFLAERFGWSVLTAPEGAKVHADDLFQRVRFVQNDEAMDEVIRKRSFVPI